MPSSQAPATASIRSPSRPIAPDDPALAGANGPAKAGAPDAAHHSDNDRPGDARASDQDRDDAKPLDIHPAQPAAIATAGGTEARQPQAPSYLADSPGMFLPADDPWPAAMPAAALAPPRQPAADPSAVLADDATAAPAADMAAMSAAGDTELPPAASAPRWFGGIVDMLPIDTAALDAGMQRLLDAMANTTHELLSDPRPATFTLWACMMGIGVVGAELVRRQMTCSAADAAAPDLEAGRSSGMRYRPVGNDP
jgi:hypothetical protein